MTREQVAARIRWPIIVTLIGIINPLMMTPQLHKLWTTHDGSSISILTLGILILLQGGFSLHGYFTRDKFVMYSNGAAVVMTFITILSVLHFS